MRSITTNALKNMLGMFLSDPQVYQFYLTQVNKISFVETGKKFRILYLVCKEKRIFHECEVWIERSVPRVTSLVMPNSDLSERFFFYPYLAIKRDIFFHTTGLNKIELNTAFSSTILTMGILFDIFVKSRSNKIFWPQLKHQSFRNPCLNPFLCVR